MRSLPLVLVGLMVGTSGCATVEGRAGTRQAAEKIEIKSQDLDSLADLLHIRNIAGTVELAEPRRHATLAIDLYKEGKKIKLERPVSVDNDLPAGIVDQKPTIKFAAQTVDLDYVTLGESKPGHCRVCLKLGIGGLVVTKTVDVPKREFDLSRFGWASSFTAEASTHDRVPLCYTISEPPVGGASIKTNSEDNPDQLIRKNPQSDVAILYLLLR